MTALSSKKTRATQAEGYQAYGEGKRLPDNPYPYGKKTREQCVAWGRGWAAARTDSIRANNRTTTEPANRFVWDAGDITIEGTTSETDS